MEINIKKTKVMVISKEEGIKCNIKLENTTLEQVSKYKYLGSWITEDARCVEDIRARIGMAKTAFWQNKELMKRNISLNTKIRILNCYVFSILNYGCESWTWNQGLCKRIRAFEMWCYRRMLKISWMDKITNEEVLSRVHEDTHFMRNMMKRKLEYAGHVMRGSSGETHLCILEGKEEGMRARGRPRRNWMNDILEWMEVASYGEVKRAAEDKLRWRSMVSTFCLKMTNK